MRQARRYLSFLGYQLTAHSPLDTKQPGHISVFPEVDDPVVNGTIFVLLVDQDIFVTPYNFSLLDAHVAAGPAVYQAG